MAPLPLGAWHRTESFRSHASMGNLMGQSTQSIAVFFLAPHPRILTLGDVQRFREVQASRRI